MSRLHLNFLKKYKSLQETIDLAEYLNDESFLYSLQEKPFKYVVIDNFFKPEFLNQIKEKFDKTIELGLTEDHNDLSRFRFFNPKINYDGYLFTPQLTDEEPLKLFYSLNWNLFFSKMFNKPTTFGTNFALHHHPTGDRTGWVHNDYATFVFPQLRKLSNGVHRTFKEEQDGLDRPKGDLPEPYLQKRVIALIYYFNNDEWKEGDGGETGLYSSKNIDDLVAKIAPINNRMLAFDISPKSFHAFQKNLKERNCFVQWFHSDLEWCEEKYGFI